MGAFRSSPLLRSVTAFRGASIYPAYFAAFANCEHGKNNIPVIDGGSKKERVNFYLYARKNGAPAWIRYCPEAHYDWSEQWKLDKKVYILVHGFSNDVKSNFVYLTAEALAQCTNDNIVAVDWRHWSRCITPISYYWAVFRAQSVGAEIANFLRKSSMELNFCSEEINFVAHSLGCHVAHFSAKNFHAKVGSITALDPAGPIFRSFLRKDRLCPNDASSVLVLHTNGGPWWRPDRLGILDPCGTTDIYVNGGEIQPGCGPCESHSLAYRIFIASMKNPMTAVGNGNAKTVLGLNISNMTRGVFHLNI